jgi:hypothetical protein
LALQLPALLSYLLPFALLIMASPAHSSHSRLHAHYQPRMRRSSFNGAKQLAAVQAPTRRALLAVALLVAALAAAVGTIAYHLLTGN